MVLYVHWMSVWTSLQHAWMDIPACLVDRYAIRPPSSEPSEAAGPRFHRRSWRAVRGGPVGQLAAGLGGCWRAGSGGMGCQGVRWVGGAGRGVAWYVWALRWRWQWPGGAVVPQPRSWRRGVCAVPAVGPGVCLDWGDGGRAAAGHRIGWLFLGMGLVAAPTGFGFQYAVRAGITDPGSPPAGWLLAAVAGWT